MSKGLRRQIAWVVVCLRLLLPLNGSGEGDVPAPGRGEDLIKYCTIRASHNTNHLDRLTDYNFDTVWTSGTGKEQYLQVLKDIPGVATLSVQWVEKPEKVTLEQRIKGVFYPLETFEGDVPDHYTLLEEDVSYRLLADEGFAISEIRVTMGEDEPYDFDNMPGRDPSHTPEPEFIMRRGDSNPQVQALQEKLVTLGYMGSSATGTFAKMTEKAVAAFQQEYGIEPTGVADEYTQNALEAVYLTRDPSQDRVFDNMIQVETRVWHRTSSDFVEYIRSKVGQGYVYGGQGEVSNKGFREYKASQYPKYEESILTIAEKWDGMEVFDCNGLIKSFLLRSEGEMRPEFSTNVTGASKLWVTEMGTIDTMPKEPGILLFQKHDASKGYMHIGVYTGEGVCVHSRGHMYGVVEDPMPYLWTHWGRPSWIEFDQPPEEGIEFPEHFLDVGDVARIDTSVGNGLQMYSGPYKRGNYLLPARVPNLTEVTITGVPEEEDGHYWRIVEHIDYWGNPIEGYVYARDLTGVAPLPNAPEPTPVPTAKPIPTLPPDLSAWDGQGAEPTGMPIPTPRPTPIPSPTPTPGEATPNPEPTPPPSPTPHPRPQAQSGNIPPEEEAPSRLPERTRLPEPIEKPETPQVAGDLAPLLSRSLDLANGGLTRQIYTAQRANSGSAALPEPRPEGKQVAADLPRETGLEPRRDEEEDPRG